MLRSTIVFSLLLAATAPLFAAEPFTPEEGFTSLFDGESLTGWEVRNGGKFTVEEGVIKLDGGRGWLCSEAEYGDFILKLELRFLAPKQDGGVFLRASYEGDNWPKQRYEVQCENSPRMAKLFGAQYEQDLEKTAAALKPDGEWNTYEILCRGTRCEVRLNGELVTTSDGLKVAAGRIGLQGEGGKHEYRRLQIKPLQAE